MDLRNIELVSLCDENLNRNLFSWFAMKNALKYEYFMIRDYISRIIYPELKVIMFKMMTNITIDVNS